MSYVKTSVHRLVPWGRMFWHPWGGKAEKGLQEQWENGNPSCRPSRIYARKFAVALPFFFPSCQSGANREQRAAALFTAQKRSSVIAGLLVAPRRSSRTVLVSLSVLSTTVNAR